MSTFCLSHFRAMLCFCLEHNRVARCQIKVEPLSLSPFRSLFNFLSLSLPLSKYLSFFLSLFQSLATAHSHSLSISFNQNFLEYGLLNAKCRIVRNQKLSSKHADSNAVCEWENFVCVPNFCFHALTAYDVC